MSRKLIKSINNNGRCHKISFDKNANPKIIKDSIMLYSDINLTGKAIGAKVCIQATIRPSICHSCNEKSNFQTSTLYTQSRSIMHL